MTLRTVLGLRPDVVIHTGAWTDVDGCEAEPERAWQVNTAGTRHLAEAARRVGAHLCYLSTDYVFDGSSSRPYVEWDETGPLNVYGASKLAGERELDSSSTVVRTSWLYGAGGRNIVRTVLELAAGTGPLRFVDDQCGCPTSAADLAPVVWKLAIGRRPGCYHVTNQGETTWFGLVRAVLEESGADAGRVEPIATADLDPPRPASRPAYSVLDNAALRADGEALLPHWRDALGRFVSAVRVTMDR